MKTKTEDTANIHMGPRNVVTMLGSTAKSSSSSMLSCCLALLCVVGEGSGEMTKND